METRDTPLGYFLHQSGSILCQWELWHSNYPESLRVNTATIYLALNSSQVFGLSSTGQFWSGWERLSWPVTYLWSPSCLRLSHMQRAPETARTSAIRPLRLQLKRYTLSFMLYSVAQRKSWGHLRFKEWRNRVYLLQVEERKVLKWIWRPTSIDNSAKLLFYVKTWAEPHNSTK